MDSLAFGLPRVQITASLGFFASSSLDDSDDFDSLYYLIGV